MGETVLRLMRDEDRPAIVAMMAEKELALGVGQWVPELAHPKTEAVFIFERDGKVEGAMICRQVTEVIYAGNEPEVLRAALSHEERIRELLAHLGVDSMVAWVPRVLLEDGKGQRIRGMERIMQRIGFKRVSPEYVSFEGEVDANGSQQRG